MLKNENELDEYLVGKLHLLEKVSPLNPEAIAEERKKFLMQAEQLRAAAVQRPVQPLERGIGGWFLALRGKQRRAASQLVMALVLALALIWGSAGATVYAAQQSLPDEFLYPIKTWSEDTRLVLTNSSEKKLELMLDFSNRRLEEIAQLRLNNKPIPEDTLLRTQVELDAALRIAADMNDQQLVQALGKIRQQAEVQSEQMAALMGNNSEATDPALEQLHVRLREQVQVAVEGEADLEGFRQLVRSWTRERSRSAPASDGTTPETPNGNGNPENKSTVTPGQYGPGSPEYNRPPIEKDPGDGSGKTNTEPADEVVSNPTPVPVATEQLIPAQSRP